MCFVAFLGPPSASNMEDIKVKSGEVIYLETAITGEPPPTAEWFTKDTSIKPDKRTSVKTTETTATLRIEASKRSDSGEYAVVLKNSEGSCREHVKVVVICKFACSVLTTALYLAFCNVSLP